LSTNFVLSVILSYGESCIVHNPVELWVKRQWKMKIAERKQKTSWHSLCLW